MLPTPAFFYGLYPREEITVEIEEGKTLIIRLINVSEPDKDGRRTVTYELNGMTREAFIADKNVAPQCQVAPESRSRRSAAGRRADPGLDHRALGRRRREGRERRQALHDGSDENADDDLRAGGWRRRRAHAAVGETVEAKDLIVRLRG